MARQVSKGIGLAIASGAIAAFVLARGASGDTNNDNWDPDTAPEPVTEQPDPTPGEAQPAPPEHNPFEMYPADDGALTWDDLSEDERAAAEAAQEWAETQHGAEVHNAFSAAVATTSQMRRQTQAEQVSGLEGVDTLGVVP